MAAPAGFVEAGWLVAEVYGGFNVDVMGPKSLDVLFEGIDTSYQMSGSLINSGGGALSSLTGADIPPGFYIECSGTDTIGCRWSVGKPVVPIYQVISAPFPEIEPGVLVPTVKFDEVAIGARFTLELYADCGHSVSQRVARAKVHVYYKPLAALRRT